MPVAAATRFVTASEMGGNEQPELRQAKPALHSKRVSKMGSWYGFVCRNGSGFDWLPSGVPGAWPGVMLGSPAPNSHSRALPVPPVMLIAIEAIDVSTGRDQQLLPELLVNTSLPYPSSTVSLAEPLRLTLSKCRITKRGPPSAPGRGVRSRSVR